MKLRIGIAGLGSIGKNHARILAELPDCELAAVYDTNPDAAREIAEKYETRAVATLEEFAEAIEAATKRRARK